MQFNWILIDAHSSMKWKKLTTPLSSNKCSNYSGYPSAEDIMLIKTVVGVSFECSSSLDWQANISKSGQKNPKPSVCPGTTGAEWENMFYFILYFGWN